MYRNIRTAVRLGTAKNANPMRSLLLALMLVTFTIPCVGEDTRTIKVGVYDNAPKIFLSPQGKPEGILIDILEVIAQEEGWNIQYVPGTWNEGLARLSTNRIDLMPDVAISSERMLQYSFHKVPVLTSWSQIFALPNAGISSMLDLDSKRVAVLGGSVQERELASLANGFGLSVNILTYPGFEEAFTAVAEKKADAVVSNYYYGKQHAPKFRMVGTAIVFSPSSLYYAAPLAHEASILETIDKQLIRMKKDAIRTADFLVKHNNVVSMSY